MSKKHTDEIRNKIKTDVYVTLRIHTTMTVGDLAAKAGYSHEAIRRSLGTLVNEGLIGMIERTKTTVAYQFGASQKQEKVVKYVSKEVFRGVSFKDSTMRPGCLDFEKIPSRIGDNRFQYRAPIYATSTVQSNLKYHPDRV